MTSHQPTADDAAVHTAPRRARADAFVALDLGAASSVASLIGRAAGRWRLLAAAASPATADVEALVGAMLDRFRAADRSLATELGLEEGFEPPRLVARSQPPRELAVLAVSERALEPLAAAAGRSGWIVRSASAERFDPLAMTDVLLDPSVSGALIGAGDPPGGDERSTMPDLAALVAAAAVRRPELTVVLAGGMADHATAFEAVGASGELLLAPAAGSGTPPGWPLRDLLDRARARTVDARKAFGLGIEALADTLDRRVEGIEVGLDGATRVHASPTRGPDGGSRQVIVAEAALAPRELDEQVVDGVLAWSSAPLDRHRMRDRLRDLRDAPWGDIAGDGAPLRLAAARAAVARLLAATADFGSLPAADLLVVSGGGWAVAPGPAIALAVADVVRRSGATQLAYDHARLLAPLGAIDDPGERRRLAADLSGDLLVPLGSVVMPQGMRAGRAGGRLIVHGAGGRSELELVPGGLELVDLPPGEQAVAEFQFRDQVRLGTRGRHFAVDVAGGLGGLLVDLRDIPLRLPERADRRRELIAAWQAALWPGLEA